ncbi:MAG: carboxylating nicotinate-nucleotide diphosphorylase [Bdellovibrionales bacterium]|nr:carboxylating nicotinate-nucleotide diphosphorylase [Bdellovibrionales bacterium]
MNSVPTISNAWFKEALAEDLGEGDKTTKATIDPLVQGKGTFLAKQNLVVCGTPLVSQFFQLLHPSIKLAWNVHDGAYIEKGKPLGIIEGPVSDLLIGERIALNMLQRLSGISSLTYEYTSVISSYKTKILDTRKTLPHYRTLEKYAVRCGGGVNHRMGLYDQMMIKDNHISANGGDVGKAVQKAKAAYPDTYLIVEIATKDQIDAAIDNGADRLLLDNMTNDQIVACQQVVRNRVPIEVSGGITKERLLELAQLDVDFISVGAITHSAVAVDISMKIELI